MKYIVYIYIYNIIYSILEQVVSVYNIQHFRIGSVYFTSNILAATDQLEQLCRQSKIRSCGMTQYQEKGHLSRKHCPACGVMVICSAAMPMVFSSSLTLPTFFYFSLLFLGSTKVLHLGVSVVRLA